MPCSRSIGPTRASTLGRERVGRALVVAQFALSLVLVAGAVPLPPYPAEPLAGRNRVRPRSCTLSYESIRRGPRQKSERLRAFQREMLPALAAVPGVQHVSLATGSPFNGNMNGRRLSAAGRRAARRRTTPMIQVNLVGPGYFDALGVPIPAEVGPSTHTTRANSTAGRRCQRGLRAALLRRHRRMRWAGVFLTHRGPTAHLPRDRGRRQGRALPNFANNPRSGWPTCRGFRTTEIRTTYSSS